MYIGTQGDYVEIIGTQGDYVEINHFFRKYFDTCTYLSYTIWHLV